MNIDLEKIVHDASLTAAKEALNASEMIFSLPEDIADDIETYKLLIAYTNALVKKSLEEYHKTICQIIESK